MAAENEHRAMSLLDLPNEVLNDICSQLCIHCQLIQSADIDQETTAAALQGQQALARLSRCSKLLQEIAQPVLFHFFCSERSPLNDDGTSEFRESNIEAHNTMYTRAVYQLSGFVRTIIKRPDLKTKVRVFTLYTVAIPHVRTRHERINEILRSQDALICSLYIGGMDDVVAATRPTLTPQKSYLQVLGDLQYLALALCRSTLEDLLLDRAVFPFWSRTAQPSTSTRWAWDYELPRLTRLLLPGMYNGRASTCTIESAQYFLHHAPNLRVFVAPDCTYDHHWSDWAVVMLSCLTRLSVTGVTVSRLKEILECCPAIEELEYQNPSDDYTPIVPLNLDAVKATIRRLCFSSASSRLDGAYSPDDTTDWRWTTMVQMCLASYNRLEILQIDRCFLFGGNKGSNGGGEGDTEDEENAEEDTTAPSVSFLYLLWVRRNFYTATTAEKFLSMLPPALRVLRVGFVRCWPAMYRDAVALASQAPERFPHLREVSIFVAREAPEDDVRALVSLFSASGIVASVGPVEMCRGILARGLLPPRPGMTVKETEEGGWM